jgi:hypothetical protein
VTLDRYEGWTLDVSVTARGATALVISNTFGRVTCAIDLARFDLFGAAR